MGKNRAKASVADIKIYIYFFSQKDGVISASSKRGRAPCPAKTASRGRTLYKLYFHCQTNHYCTSRLTAMSWFAWMWTRGDSTWSYFAELINIHGALPEEYGTMIVVSVSATTL